MIKTFTGTSIPKICNLEMNSKIMCVDTYDTIHEHCKSVDFLNLQARNFTKPAGFSSKCRN